jgi:hypothetical protein
MKPALISVTLLSVLTASANAATESRAFDEARPPEASTGEGGDGLQSVRLAGAAASTFLFVPDARQSLLVPVAEGGEGGEGRRGRRWRRHHGEPYGYRGFRSRESGYRRYPPPYSGHSYYYEERRYHYGPRRYDRY